MESRTRVLLLTLVLAVGLSGCASLKWPWFGRHKPAEPTVDETTKADEDPSSTAPPRVIDPQVERRKIKVPHIRAKNVELGGYYGEISIQDFGAQPVAGARLDYHISEDLFAEVTYGRAKGGKTSFELLSGSRAQLLSDAERRFTYYNVSLGYNFLPGEVFIGRNLAMTSALYVLGGIGNVTFAGDHNFAVNFGVGFRVLPTDWLALHIDVQDIVFKSNVIGVYQLKNNLQGTIGASVFF